MKSFMAASLSVFVTSLTTTTTTTTLAFHPAGGWLNPTTRIVQTNKDTRLASSTLATPVMPLTNNNDDSTVKVLALHDVEGTSSAFTSTLNNWRDQMVLKHDLHLDITALQAPIKHGKGYAWWDDTASSSSTTTVTDSQQGLEESISQVLEEMEKESFDLIIGHGQGAALTTALLAENKVKEHPTIGYVLNNPSLPPAAQQQLLNDPPSLDDSSILLLTGMRDKVVAPTESAEIKDAMSRAGATVTEIKHPKGHAVPIQSDETLRLALQWVVDKKQEA